MRVAVMGSGGLGGYYGARLAQAGEEVTFIARGAHLAAMRAHGLTIKSDLAGEFTLPVAATDDPTEVAPVDLILFCVKTYDLEPAAEQIRPLVGSDTMVLPVQNGADIAEQVGRFVGPEHVLGGLSYLGGTVQAPGVVAQQSTAGAKHLVFGELVGGTSPRAERLLETFERAGIVAELHPDVRVPIWQKFVVACANLGITSLTRLPIGALMACPETAALYRGVMEEVEAVARAKGVALPEGAVDRLMMMLAGVNPAWRSSMYHDLMAGRRLELEAMNGSAVRLGRACGIPTPLNFSIYAALKPYADGVPAP